MLYSPIAIDEIQTGDLLIWRSDKVSLISDLSIRLVQFLTKSEWGHVGIAWRVTDGVKEELFVIEATIPRIQIMRVIPEHEVYHLPANLSWSQQGRDFLLTKIGLRYSFLDAFRALMGWTVENDDRWQCAELVHAYYESEGLRLPPELKPKDIVKHLQRHTGAPIRRIVDQNLAEDLGLTSD